MNKLWLVIALFFSSLHAHSPTPIPRHAQEVLSFFNELESKKAYIPNILEISPDEFDLRIAQMSSSIERIISLLAYHPNPKSYALIRRFFEMYSIVAGKQLDFTNLAKNDPHLLKQHELKFLRKQINMFTDAMEKELMFVARNDDLSLQMGYDMMIVNTYFKQLFPPAAFPRASAWSEFIFNLKHNRGTRRRAVNILVISGLTIGTYFGLKAFVKEQKEKRNPTPPLEPKIIEVPVEVPVEITIEVPVEVPSTLNEEEKAFMTDLADDPKEARQRLEKFIFDYYTLEQEATVTSLSISGLIRMAQMASAFAPNTANKDFALRHLLEHHFPSIAKINEELRVRAAEHSATEGSATPQLPKPSRPHLEPARRGVWSGGTTPATHRPLQRGGTAHPPSRLRFSPSPNPTPAHLPSPLASRDEDASSSTSSSPLITATLGTLELDQ